MILHNFRLSLQFDACSENQALKSSADRRHTRSCSLDYDFEMPSGIEEAKASRLNVTATSIHLANMIPLHRT
jgi:hypothetical protein